MERRKFRIDGTLVVAFENISDQFSFMHLFLSHKRWSVCDNLGREIIDMRSQTTTAFSELMLWPPPLYTISSAEAVPPFGLSVLFKSHLLFLHHKHRSSQESSHSLTQMLFPPMFCWQNEMKIIFQHFIILC